MGFEADNRNGKLQLSAFLRQRLYDLTMAGMYAIVITDGSNASVMAQSDIVFSTNEFHQFKP
jgi:hypothetical protein